jgi:hypothetical protein
VIDIYFIKYKYSYIFIFNLMEFEVCYDNIPKYAIIGKPFFIFGYKFLLETHNKLFFLSKNKKIEILVANQDIFMFKNPLISESEVKSFCICGRVFYIKNKNLYLAGTPDGKGKTLINTCLKDNN